MQVILNLDDTLERINQDKSLCLSILKEFLRSYSDSAEQISKRVEEKEMIAAAALVHSLKGISSNIGAEPLSLSAKRLEQAIKSNDQEQISTGLAHYSKQQTDTLKAVEQAIVHITEQLLIEQQLADQKASASTASQLSDREIQQTLEAANNCFGDDYAEALNLIEQLSHKLPSDHYPSVHHLLDLMRIFDIAAAKQALSKLSVQGGKYSD